MVVIEIKKKSPPSKQISGINKIWYLTYVYTPRYPVGGGI